MAAKVAGYRTDGYTRFQLKVGGDPDVDIERVRPIRAMLKAGDRLVADANTGWTQAQSDSRRSRRAQRGCIHRTAVPQL